jgi:LacI family transcriptional regulator
MDDSHAVQSLGGGTVSPPYPYHRNVPAAQPKATASSSSLQSKHKSFILPRMSKKANQTVIARQLNLAPGTVSRALRHQPGIKLETRERILKLAAELGYSVKPRGKAAATNDNSACYLGVLVQSPESALTHSRYLVSLSEAAASMNVTLIVHHVLYSECGSILNAEKQPAAMRDGRVRGLVLVHRWPEDVVAELSQRFPCVSIVHFYPSQQIDLIDMDHRGGMNKLAEHLHGLGHRNIGFFGRCGEISWSRARYAGYVEAMSKLELPIDIDWTLDVASDCFDQRNIPQDVTARAVEFARNGVTAWMATNEWAGQALVQAFRNAGLRVPEDVSVTGFDNSDVIRHPVINLTSVGVSLTSIGTAAIRRLYGRLANPNDPWQSILFRVELVPGASTGPCRKRD